ncbi:MAG: GNAT family N-acetyltransferase, partial [Bacteroidales bacterium]
IFILLKLNFFFMTLSFRTIPKKEDARRIHEIVESTGYFYDYEIDVAIELIEERLRKGEESEYYFVFAEIDGKTVAFSCYGPDPVTRSSFELYWIVTHKNYTGKGIGRKLLDETHLQARRMGCTLIVAETSGRERYASTRSFYDKSEYKLEAIIKDYYDKGDDKCIYVKRFN